MGSCAGDRPPEINCRRGSPQKHSGFRQLPCQLSLVYYRSICKLQGGKDPVPHACPYEQSHRSLSLCSPLIVHANAQAQSTYCGQMATQELCMRRKPTRYSCAVDADSNKSPTCIADGGGHEPQSLQSLIPRQPPCWWGHAGSDSDLNVPKIAPSQHEGTTGT